MKNSIVLHNGRVEANLHAYIYEQDGYIIADCDILNTVGYGTTEEEAIKSLEVQLDIFFEETIKNGTLDRLLKQYGWRNGRKFSFVQNKPLPSTLPGVHTRTHELAICT